MLIINLPFQSVLFRILGLIHLLGPHSVLAGQTSYYKNEKTYLTLSDISWKKTDSYSDIYCKIALQTQSHNNSRAKADAYAHSNTTAYINAKATNGCEEFQKRESYHTMVNGYTKMHLHKEKPELVIITIHGLWFSADQFSQTLQEISKQTGRTHFNSIELALPGHIKSESAEDFKRYYKYASRHKPRAKFRDWLLAFKSTLALAKQLGHKTIIIGHSTGGALGVIGALKYSNMVDELILVEPALQVQQLTHAGSCLGRFIPETVFSFLSRIAKKFGAPTAKAHADMGMGCEVQKLVDHELVTRKPSVGERNEKPFAPNDEVEVPLVIPPEIPEIPYTVEDMSPYKDLGRKIKIPILLVNNENDLIVSPTAIKYFYLGLKGHKKYISINEDDSISHGSIMFTHPAQLAELIINFTSLNLSKTGF